MKGRGYLFILIIMLGYCKAFAGSGFVKLADSTKLFYVKGTDIYSPDKDRLLYFSKGNIFFNGQSDQKENIYLVSTSMNPGSEELQSLMEKGNREASYSFSNNKFYAGREENEEFRERNALLYVNHVGKWMAFYSSYNDSLLAYYPYDSLPASTAIITAYTLIKKYKLEEKAVRQTQQIFENDKFSTIKPLWGNVTANEWIWDGQVLRPRWNVDPRFAWTFDGQTIKPVYGNNIYAQYSWDGETFKPLWRNNRAEEWSWDGRLMKPIWDTDWANQYVMDGGIVKPWSNVHTEKEWQLDGSIPVPLIILVISGLAVSN